MPTFETVEELKQSFADSKQKYREIWVSYDENQHMCALINNNIGWVMYVSDECEAGLCTRNMEYKGNFDDEIEYVLDNGQEDLYPVRWAIGVTEIYTALATFIETGVLDNSLTWIEDDR
jgi:hypothetical protein